MKNTKKKYVNEDIDGYKEENQSPLAPAWLFSGKQNEGKVLKGGPNGFVVWGSGGSGGTTDYDLLENKPQLNGTELIGNTILTYNNLTNKPQLNGVELAGNITFPYVKTASVNGNTLILTLVDSNEEVTLNLEINIESIKNAVLAEVATQYFNKQEILDSFYTKSQINDSFYTKSAVDDKTSSEQHYLKNKAQLKQGEYIQLTKDDANKTITIAQSLKPDPEAPTTGIVFKDDTMNDYVILNNDDVFDPTHTTINGTYANSEGSYSSPRTLFNPQNKIIVNADVPNLAKNNGSLGFFGDCLALNTPIDLSMASTNLPISGVNWDTTGYFFLRNCISFNSTITFNQKITKIQKSFMIGCTNFNNQLIDLFTPSLKEIDMNFMQTCHNFAQDLDFSNTSLNVGSTGYNKIVLINFMRDCNNMGNHSINLGNKGLNCFKQNGYATSVMSGVARSLTTENESSPAYVNGINFICYNATAQDFYDFIVTSQDGTAQVVVFRKSADSPFRKILVNNVEVQ